MRDQAVHQVVGKTAQNPETARKPVLFYSSAREGMADFLDHTVHGPDSGVLLPAFIGLSQREGSGVLDPVASSGARAGFYKLHPDLSVDLHDLSVRLATGSYEIVVVIHYYGRTEPRLAEIHKLVESAGALLVEDLAHGFFTDRAPGAAGMYGQVSLFSLHKMFPFRDGGMIRYADPCLLQGQASSRPDLAQSIIDFDWGLIAGIRRKNFRELSERLAELTEYGGEFDLLWKELNDDDVPQTLPVRILSDRRDAVYTGMNAEGYGMVSLYHTLIPQVRDGFEALQLLSRHVINFPIHQDVQVSRLDGMVESFRRHLFADGITS